MLFLNQQGIQVEVGSLSLVSSGKNPIITFQHFVIHWVWKNSTLLHLSLTPKFRMWQDFQPIMSHFRECTFLLDAMAVLLSNRWCCYELIGCWNKWSASWSKSGLLNWQDELQVTPSAGLSRAETDQFTPLQLSLQPFCLIMNRWSKLYLKERATQAK